ncbi:GNAT family N-acetyltransferase [archaeon]|nr:GNAT family N-acetyltransferase [archaeon]|tara:strand:- start:1480 stop:2013 length:534 start_codon:yes stop_codon:yes gene_type:complete
MTEDIKLIGENIYLRQIEESDVEGNYPEWFNDKEVCKYNGHGEVVNTKEKTLEYVKSVRNSEHTLVFAIIDKNNDRHIGNISLQKINKKDSNAEIAIIIGEKDYWGTGVGKEAWKLIMDYGFSKMNLHRLYCGTNIENIGMQKLAENCGMEKEGISKDGMLKNGKYYDLVHYGKIKK